MSDIFDAYWPKLQAEEGGATYTNRTADRGGPTKYGVDAATLGAARGLNRPATAAEVQALEEPEAKAILRQRFFADPGFDNVAAISPRIAEELLDTGVNMGPHWPITWLQEDLNLSNRQGLDFADVTVDGSIGPKTLVALQALIQRRGQRATEDLLLKCLNGDQYGRYKDITAAGGPNSPAELNFIGWITARIGFPA